MTFSSQYIFPWLISKADAGFPISQATIAIYTLLLTPKHSCSLPLHAYTHSNKQFFSDLLSVLEFHFINKLYYSILNLKNSKHHNNHQNFMNKIQNLFLKLCEKFTIYNTLEMLSLRRLTMANRKCISPPYCSWRSHTLNTRWSMKSEAAITGVSTHWLKHVGFILWALSTSIREIW